jgi:hypothetical protein
MSEDSITYTTQQVAALTLEAFHNGRASVNEEQEGARQLERCLRGSADERGKIFCKLCDVLGVSSIEGIIDAIIHLQTRAKDLQIDIDYYDADFESIEKAYKELETRANMYESELRNLRVRTANTKKDSEGLPTPKATTDTNDITPGESSGPLIESTNLIAPTEIHEFTDTDRINFLDSLGGGYGILGRMFNYKCEISFEFDQSARDTVREVIDLEMIWRSKRKRGKRRDNNS